MLDFPPSSELASGDKHSQVRHWVGQLDQAAQLEIAAMWVVGACSLSMLLMAGLQKVEALVLSGIGALMFATMNGLNRKLRIAAIERLQQLGAQSYLNSLGASGSVRHILVTRQLAFETKDRS